MAKRKKKAIRNQPLGTEQLDVRPDDAGVPPTELAVDDSGEDERGRRKESDGKEAHVGERTFAEKVARLDPVRDKVVELVKREEKRRQCKGDQILPNLLDDTADSMNAKEHYAL